MLRALTRRATAIAFTVVAALSGAAAAQCPGQWLEGQSVPGVNGYVYAMAWADPDGPGPLPPVLAVAGNFTVAGSTPAINIATWDGTDWSAVGAGVRACGGVRALAALNGELVAGGQLLPGNPSNFQAIMHWTGSAWEPMGGQLDGSASALAVVNGQLYAGGRFRSASFGSPSYDVVTRWDGSAWSPISNINFNGSVLTLGEDARQPVAGGGFSLSNFTASNLVRWNGTAWTGFGAGVQIPVRTFATFGTDLVAAGDEYPTIIGQRVFRWNGSAWTTMGTFNTSQPIRALSVLNGQLYMASDQSPGFFRRNGASWPSTATLRPFLSAFYCMTTDGASLYAGGQLNRI